ncbi:transferase [Helicobacter didelphidarum]|uniref:Transferase n=1 Tax=Helicobacter didelphidarum TaxID=2040648 RepID=A0A3D8IPG4_9HELI|nr:transferase [Helicobacter didelphidarum]RDU66514.1 transferase [Helicobacter didelphidarum]
MQQHFTQIPNGFYSVDELQELGLKSIGKNVLLSRLARFYGVEQISIGDNVRIDDFVILSGNITIGSFIHIGAGSILTGGSEGIIVENFVSISSACKIFSTSDDYSGESMSNPTIPNAYKNIISRPIHIGKHAMMGSTSIVLPSSMGLSEGVSVGALSVVIRPTKPYGIYMGNPARRILERSKNLLELEKNFLDSLQISGGGGRNLNSCLTRFYLHTTPHTESQIYNCYGLLRLDSIKVRNDAQRYSFLTESYQENIKNLYRISQNHPTESILLPKERIA